MGVIVSGLASRGDVILGAGAGVFTWPLTVMRDVRVARFRDGWPVAFGCVDLVRAGQAAVAGGPHAASKRLSHSWSWCQPSGRCKVRWPRPWRAVRAATSMRSRRTVAPRALA